MKRITGIQTTETTITGFRDNGEIPRHLETFEFHKAENLTTWNIFYKGNNIAFRGLVLSSKKVPGANIDHIQNAQSLDFFDKLHLLVPEYLFRTDLLHFRECLCTCGTCTATSPVLPH